MPVSLSQFEHLLAADSRQGHVQYAMLGLSREGDPARVYKARVICNELGGKSSGLRYVYEQIVSPDGLNYCVCLAVYSHQSDIDENDIQSRIRRRFTSYDAYTLEELDDPLS